jgi:phosphoglycolate phosphatase
MSACQGVHDLGPHARLSPANEAIVAGRIRTEVVRQVAPWRPRSQDPNMTLSGLQTNRTWTRRPFGRYIQAMTPTGSVLLDLDGTLIDSQPGILASCLAALRALGHEPDETLDIKRTIGPPLEDIMGVLLQPYGDDGVGEAVAAYRQHYGESGFLGSEPYPGIGSSLKEMQQAGLRIYLVTSKREIFASRILHHLGFATYFDGIHGSVPGGGLDHKPELLAHILSQHNVLLSHSLMVGDRRYDISGAHAVGMRCLGVLWGYGTRDELESAGADRLVESTADLARTVLSMVSGKQSAS